MSYNDFSSNPNNFGAQGGRQSDRNRNNDLNDPSTNTGFSSQDSGLGSQAKTWDRSEGGGNWNNQQSGGQDPYSGNTTTSDTPGTGGNFTGGTGGTGGYQAGGRDPYSGNTSSFNDPGAGGAFGDQNTNTQWNRSAGTNTDNYGSGTGTGDNYRDNAGQNDQAGGKPSFGQRVKGSVEKTAGRVAGKPEMQERGEERRAGGNQF